MDEQRGDGIRTLEGRVGAWVLKGTGLALTLAVTVAVVRPADPNIAYSRPLVLTGLVFALALAIIVSVMAGRQPRRHAQFGRSSGHPNWPWIIAAATSALGGLAGYLLAQPLMFSYGWDAAVVTGFSRELSSGQGLSDYAQDYLSRYPNNMPVIAMMNVARAIGGPTDADMYATYLRANGICLAVILFATFLLVRRLRGTGPAFLAQGAVFGLVGCSPWMAVPYTDIPAMAFVSVAVTLGALAMWGRPWWRLALVVSAFATAAVAFVLKSTPASLAVAFGLVLLLVLIAGSAPGRRRVGAGLACGVLAFTLTALGSLAVADTVAHVDRAQLDTSRTPPVRWWLANGLTRTENPGARPYFGAYSPEMVKASMHLSGEDLQQWSARRLAEQVSGMGPPGILSFELRKLAFNWGDGMFFVWGAYDWQPERLQQHGPTATAIQAWQHALGEHYPLRSALTTGSWLAIVLWGGVGLLRSHYRRDLLVVAVSVLGIGMFTLVFQGGSRYLFAFVPVVVALAASVDPLARGQRQRAAARADGG